jgi:hypothetical protein
MVITYYLAIERAPFLETLFPSFVNYASFLILVGVPTLGFAGYIHFKRISAYKSEQEVAVESNPFIYKLPPGFAKHVNFPHQLMMNRLMLKLLTNEKITEEEIKEMKGLQKKMEHLIDGGHIGDPNKKQPFYFTDKDKF